MTQNDATPTTPMSRMTRNFQRLGPAWIAGAIAAGPATMASVLAAGAGFGYPLLWVIVLSAVLGAFAVTLAMQLGLRTEEGIVTTVRRRIGDTWAWILVIDLVLAAGLAQLVIMRTVAAVSAEITGVSATAWGIYLWGTLWAVVLALGLATGGYRFLERGAKALVIFVVLAFVASLFVVPFKAAQLAGVFRPAFPTDLQGALVVAGVMGGAVHITLITMHTYTMRARGWTLKDTRIARFDVLTSMLVMFGLYSVAIFLVAAAVLHVPGQPAGPLTAIGASQALGPLVGEGAKWLFLAGLWGAAISTLGGNTVVPPYLLADRLGWSTTVKDPRYRGLIIGFALLSGLGVFFLTANFFTLLTFVLAFGLIGTLFAIAIVLYLLNHPQTPGPRPSSWTNLGGFVLLNVVAILCANFVGARVKDGLLTTMPLGPIPVPVNLLVVAFALFIVAATLVLAGKFLVIGTDADRAAPGAEGTA